MNNIANIEPVDYLLIGHITQDILPNGFALGGTASYSALTAVALGLRVGLVTSCAPDLALPELAGVRVVRKESTHSTTFENIYTPNGRVQYIHNQAAMITAEDIPSRWKNTPIVHLGPVAQEVDPALASFFPHSFVGVTPQGWLRCWNDQGKVSPCKWDDYKSVLAHSNIAILSLEDVSSDEDEIQQFAEAVPILVITYGEADARVYWNGDVRVFRPPHKKEVDATGAGDIFATSFFFRYSQTRDPWESARFATAIAANSVTRKTLQGVPTQDEIKTITSQIVK